MPAWWRLPGAHGAGEAGADDGRGDQRQERHPVERQQELRDLLRGAEAGLGHRGAGGVQQRQVQRGQRGEARGRDQQREAGCQHAPPAPRTQCRASSRAALRTARSGAPSRRPPLPGQRIARRAVGHCQHQPGSAGRRAAAGSARRRRCSAARPQMIWSAPTSSRLATYIVRLAIRTWLGAGSPSAAATSDGAAICASDSTAQSAKKLADPLAEPGVEDGDDQPDVRAQLLRPQRRVQVAEIVLVQDGQAARGGQAGRKERLGCQLGVLEHAHAGHRRHPGRVPVGCRRHDRGHGDAVPGCQLLGHPRRQGIGPAEDDVIRELGWRELLAGLRGHEPSLVVQAVSMPCKPHQPAPGCAGPGERDDRGQEGG